MIFLVYKSLLLTFFQSTLWTVENTGLWNANFAEFFFWGGTEYTMFTEQPVNGIVRMINRLIIGPNMYKESKEYWHR